MIHWANIATFGVMGLGYATLAGLMLMLAVSSGRTEVQTTPRMGRLPGRPKP